MEDWPLILIFNNHLEVQSWVTELHEELAEPTVASVFAMFSTVMNVAVRARKIPASPCQGIRVSARWSPPHEYDEVNRAIRVIEPLAEAQGQLVKAKRPTSSASKRWRTGPPCWRSSPANHSLRRRVCVSRSQSPKT
jgi:hypothetical protein